MAKIIKKDIKGKFIKEEDKRATTGEGIVTEDYTVTDLIEALIKKGLIIEGDL